MKNYKIYGYDHTVLELSEKAEKAYNDSDFDRIIEIEVGGQLIYEIYNNGMGRDRLIKGNMTADEVDEFYCDLADEIDEQLM